MIGLEFIRKAHNDTMQSLADKLGLTKGLISQWENKKCDIPDKRIAELASLYDVPTWYLTKELTNAEEMIVMQKINNKYNNEDIHREQILDKIRKLMIRRPEIVYFMEELVESFHNNKTELNKLMGKSMFEILNKIR